MFISLSYKLWLVSILQMKYFVCWLPLAVNSYWFDFWELLASLKLYAVAN